MAPPAPIIPCEGFALKLTTIQLVGGIRCHVCKLTFGDKKDYDSHYQNHYPGQPDIIYTCVVCLKEFSDYPKFRGHCYTIHVMKDKFKCDLCNKLFSKQAALNLHINAVHLFKCSRCQKEFTSKRELNIHEFIHKNDNPPYKCLSCSQEIMTSDQCEGHIDLHSEISYSCLICNESIENKQQASKHLHIHFNYMKDEPESDFDDQEHLQTDSSVNAVGGIFCIYCKSLHRDRVEFLSHLTTEHPDQPEVYTCGVCLKEFSLYSLFGRHVYNHIAKDRFQCEVCNKNFDRLPHLVLHMEAFHTVLGDKPFSCIYCSRAFQTEMRLRHHLREFHNTYSLTCQELGCGQVFKTPKDLLLHSKIHKNTENRCRFCGLQFISMSACLRHLDVHCKTVYSCPVCDKKYGEKYLLKKHMTQHFEVVIHMCKVCGKTFNARSRLVAHSKTHTNTMKIHTCSYCGKGFTREQILQQHLNIHSGSRPFKCLKCQKSFASYPNWGKHMRKIHNYSGKLRDLLVTESMEQNGNKINGNDCKKPIILSNIKICNGTDKMQTDSNIKTEIEDIFTPKDFNQVHNSLDVPRFENDNIIELHNVIIEDYLSFDDGVNLKQEFPLGSSASSQYPPEYGPEFPLSITGETLDEFLLPHINPHLATKTEPTLAYNYQF